jgi:hypothetical protein
MDNFFLRLQKQKMNSSDLVSKIRLQSMAGCCVGPQGPKGDTGTSGMIAGKEIYAGVSTGLVYFNHTFDDYPIVTLTQYGGTIGVVLRVTEVAKTHFTWTSTGETDFTLFWTAMLAS